MFKFTKMISIFVLLLCLTFIISSCASKQQIGDGGIKPPQGPSELSAKSFHQRLNLKWKTNRQPTQPIVGYNIYVSDQPVLDTDDEIDLRKDLKPYHNPPYPGDTDPAFEYETIDISGVENGKSYHIFVTTVLVGGLESVPSNEIEVIPRPEGTFTIQESFKGSKSGFSFRKVKSTLTDDLANDIYLTKINGQTMLASPSRIDDVLRKTIFYRLGKSSKLEDVNISELKMKSSEKLAIYSGEVAVLKDADNCFALIRFDHVNHNIPEVQISYIYQAKTNTLKF